MDKVNLAAIRARYGDAGSTPPSRVLRELSLDPRPGAQALYRQLKRRREAARGEEVRLAALLNFERVLWKAGLKHVAGVDEVGVGPLAGPVVAAAVVLPADIDLQGVDDSKKLHASERERLSGEIHRRAVAVSIAEVGVEDIDRLNIYHAGLEAMRRAVSGLAVRPDHVLVDARTIPGLGAIPQNAFDRGDGLNYSIACASIVAKVYRDRLMGDLAGVHPGYGFEKHKGYSTAEHLAAVQRLGPCPIHRQSFPVFRELGGDAGAAFYVIRSDIDAARSLAELAAARERLRAETAGLSDAETRKLLVLLARRRKRLAG